MTACESRTAQSQNELADFVIARYPVLCAAVTRQVTAVAGRTPAGFDAERWVSEALTQAFEQLEGLADDEAAHTEFLAYWQRGLVRAARNAAIDDFDRNRKLALGEDDGGLPEPKPAYVESEDLEGGVVERLDSERRLQALGAVVRVLCARGGSGIATHITADEWQTLQTYAQVRRDAERPSAASGPADDDTLHAEQIRRNQREREEWARDWTARRAGRSRRRRDGLRAATAESLGISTTTVAARLKKVADAVWFTRYLAGVLAHRGSLRHPRCIARHLDVADAWMSAGYTEDRRALMSAAGKVHTTDEFGTRVDRRALDDGDAGRPGGAAEQVHQAETRYIDHVRASSPNCVAVCAAHTRPGAVNRATEI
ncbi:hypothetical protein [Micropruina sp.]|uniref:hypothetical protein n=1 Tax=Micropruina sp. TaxID=2737536 RepID=UPI0039E60187